MLSIVYFSTKQSFGKFKKVLIIIVGLIPLNLYGTRSWLYLPIIAMIISRGLILNKWPSKKMLFLFPFIGIALFGSTYLLRGNVGNGYEAYKFVFIHSFGYLTAGIQGANTILIDDYKQIEYFKNFLFVGLINLFKFITFNKDYISINNPIFVHTNYLYSEKTNVFSIYGSIFYAYKFFGSIYIFILSLLIYILNSFCKIANKKSVYIYYSFVLAGLALGWYEFYLSNLLYLELILILILFHFIRKITYKIN